VSTTERKGWGFWGKTSVTSQLLMREIAGLV
jgi:hypothetical protein